MKVCTRLLFSVAGTFLLASCFSFADGNKDNPARDFFQSSVTAVKSDSQKDKFAAKPISKKGRDFLDFTGIGKKLEVKDSSKIRIESGATFCTVVNLDNVLEKAGDSSNFDMFVCKEKEFIFGRREKRLYFNLHNGKSWQGAVFASGNFDFSPKQWYHLAVTVDRHEDPSQGENWLTVIIYVNGLPVSSRKIMDTKVNQTENPIEIGTGFGDKVWNLNAYMAGLTYYDRPLKQGEIEKLVLAEPLVKPLFEIPVDLSEKSEAALEELKKLSADIDDAEKKDVVSGISSSLENLARLGVIGEDKLQNIPQKLSQDIAESQSAENMLTSWNSRGELLTLDNEQTCLNLKMDKANKVFYLAGLYDKISGRELLCGKQKLWSLDFIVGKETYRLDSLSSGLKAELSRITGCKKDGWNFSTIWTHRKSAKTPVAFQVKCRFRYFDDKLSYDISVNNRLRNVYLDKVTYPRLTFAPLTKGKDILITPHTCGVMTENPIAVKKTFSHNYPTGHASLQMGAYYDNQTGIYFSTEDPAAQYKEIVFDTSRGRLDISYTWWAVRNRSGGNDFSSDCTATVNIFRGDWYDAGLIYKKWLSEAAPWWPRKQSVSGVPEWFRNNVFWMRVHEDESQIPELLESVKQVRDMIDLPIAIHWYSWNNHFNDDYPHYNESEITKDTIQKLKEMDIRVVPYLNGRLWETKDRDDEDWMYSSHGKSFSVKKLNGEPFFENYSKRKFGVMCPACKGWQKFFAKTCNHLLDVGFDGLYLDQVAAGREIRCYDKTHGHELGGGKSWWRGNVEMLKMIRRHISEKRPETILTTEDNAEAYADTIEGMLGWRWMTMGEIPLFHLIYGGRVQFVGRHIGTGSAVAIYNMFARQLINGEQLGWSTKNLMLDKSKIKICKYVRDLCHVRKALCDVFNDGTLGRSIKFTTPQEILNMKWGIWGTQYVKSPVIENSSWIFNGRCVMVFVNTGYKDITNSVDFDAARYEMPASPVHLHKISCSQKTTDKRADTFSEKLTIPGRDVQVWVIEPESVKPDDNDPLLTGLTETFDKISEYRKQD